METGFALDTIAFLNGFYRMVNRKGVPREVIRDNDGCFVAANRELKEIKGMRGNCIRIERGKNQRSKKQHHFRK